MSRNILVTGGAGYIGSHTCKELAHRGYHPVAFDNMTRGTRTSVKWGPLVLGDLQNKHELRQAMDAFQIEAVVHFAALAYVGESVEVPARYFRNNVTGTLNLLEAMAEAHIPNLIFSSTCAVYGIPDHVPITEDAPTKPINPYGETKLQTENMLPWFGRAHGLNWVALRYFNAAGADPDGEIGENHNPETHLIPLAIQAAIGGGPPLRVLGTDYPTQDGTAVRDFIHVTDLADAHVRALGYLCNGGDSGVFNLGTGMGNSVLEIVNAIGHISNCDVPVLASDRREGDPPILVADTARANRVMGWRPRHSDLATIVSTALDWERSKIVAIAAE